MTLELQSLLTSGVGQRRHPPVIGESTTIEDHGGDAGGLGPSGDEAAHAGGRRDVAARVAPQFSFDRGGRSREVPL